jgi:hypothetical protein
MSNVAAPPSRRSWPGNLAAIVVGAVLVFSAITKILAPKAFLASMDGYGLFPTSSLLLLATAVTGLELMLGVLLMTGVHRRLAAGLATPLLVAFLALLIYGAQAGLESCGCFGQAVSIPPSVEIGIDIALLVLLGLTLGLGTSVSRGPAALRHAVAWGSLCLGAAWFLAGNPSLGAGSEELTLDRSALTMLEGRAQPPLTLGDEAFVFLFSAECDHCWAYAPTVEAMHRRLPDLSVVGVTFSGPDAIASFERAFAPTYEVYVVPSSVFDAVTTEYPAAVWISGGQVQKTWLGFVPSHRELADLGGYTLVEGPLDPAGSSLDTSLQDEKPAPADGLFGGPVSSRH